MRRPHRILGDTVLATIGLIALLFYRRGNAPPDSPNRVPGGYREEALKWRFVGSQLARGVVWFAGWLLFLGGLFHCWLYPKVIGPALVGRLEQQAAEEQQSVRTVLTTQIYETQSLMLITTSIVLAGIAISIPIIMLMWSQLSDSLVDLDRRNHLGTEERLNLRSVLAQIATVNRIANFSLPHLLAAVGAILSLLLWALIALYADESSNAALRYYSMLAYGAGLSIVASLVFIVFIYLLLQVRAITSKVRIQRRLLHE